MPENLFTASHNKTVNIFECLLSALQVLSHLNLSIKPKWFAQSLTNKGQIKLVWAQNLHSLWLFHAAPKSE